MADTVSDFLVQRLIDWGVRRVFGYPGDGINGILGACDRASDAIEFVQARHEEMAAFMAVGHAKLTGEVGVCLATSGPGAVHLLNGLYDAMLDHQPVVAIVGQQARAALGGGYQQEIDLQNLFKDVAHEYVQTVTTPEQMRHVIDQALRVALSQRCVTCVIVPSDVQKLAAVEPPREHGTVHSGIGWQPPRVVPRKEDLQKAADILNAGRRIAILVGAGASGAGDEVVALADLLGAGVAKALLGRVIVDESLPFVTGSIGLLGTKPSWEMMQQCDTLLMIGSNFPYSEYLPKEGQARGIQIEIDPRRINLRYPMEVGLVGDARETLRLLLPLLWRKEARDWQEEIAAQVTEWWALLEDRAMRTGPRLNPQRVFWELSARLPSDAVITVDTGTCTNWYARDVKVKPGMLAAVSGGLSTMGPAIPYGIAAKFAYPDRPVVALVGDGAMQMNGCAELVTLLRYWRRWRDPRFVVLVLNNRDLGHVTWEQRVLEGNPKFEDSQTLPDFPYARYAELLGFEGVVVDTPDAVAPAWERAFRAERPVLIEAVVDPHVPPIPPHLTLGQIKNFTLSMLKGDPDAAAVITTTVRETLVRTTGR
ncbi:thiamine pyrophosphate-requiring protein [Chitinimonas lacunae]|uniref:Thiamine pyrophosphate-requiring protein n=1 Tax=Chitinimonas lacunae TaxID=1963018 RepID=A0ABV8MPB5_9NEIS